MTQPASAPAAIDPAAVFAQLANFESTFDLSHRSGTITAASLRGIFDAVGYRHARTLETGCGKSTILFSLFSGEHHAFTYDDRAHERSSVGYFESCPFAAKERVKFHYGPTQRTLPVAKFDAPFDVILIDGAHGYPFADLEYYFLYPHLRAGGFLVLDDIHIPSIARMADILAEDAMFEPLVVVEQKTLILRRTKAPTLDPFSDNWHRQDYNRRRIPWVPSAYLQDGGKRPSYLPAAEAYGQAPAAKADAPAATKTPTVAPAAAAIPAVVPVTKPAAAATPELEQCLALLRKLLPQAGAWSKFEAAGFHVTPVHFYQPLPEVRTLPTEIFRKRSEMPGVDLHGAEQKAMFEQLAARWMAEFLEFPAKLPAGAKGYFIDNGFFAFMDGFMLYALLRERKPKRVIEVGSGYSTLLMTAALERNRREGHACNFESYDPFPREGLGLTELPGVTFKSLLAQQIPLEVFTSLGAGDFLFIDSSHVAKVGSDVHYLALEVYPRIARGVWLHVHDIFFPFEYPENWVREHRRFWNEQYLLQVFLQCNRDFALRWVPRYMHADHAATLSKHISGYGQGARGPGGSVWMERVN